MMEDIAMEEGCSNNPAGRNTFLAKAVELSGEGVQRGCDQKLTMDKL